MATTKRETDPRTKRTTRNMSPVLKLTEPSQGLRRARSVPSSPDRKLSPAPAPSSSIASRPSSSFNARTTSPRPTSGSSSSSNHGKALHPPSSMATAKPASSMAMRGKADKAGSTTRWPRALATNSLSSKDMNKAAKTVSTLQKSGLSPKPGVDKMTLPLSPKPKTQSANPGALSGSRITQDGNKKTGTAKLAPILRTRSVPARSIHPPKTEEQEMELLMEFDEAESISTPSIEEHLQERLPDPVDLTHVDAIAYVSSLNDQSQPEPSSIQQEDKIDQFRELIPKEEHKALDNCGLNGGEINTDDAGINNEVHTVNEAEREVKEDFHEAELNKVVDETELREAVVAPVVVVKKEAEAKVEKVMPQTKTPEPAQGGRKDGGKSNEVKEEVISKPAGRKNKIMALIGKFETAMSS